MFRPAVLNLGTSTPGGTQEAQGGALNIKFY
jgi:hypothetical protein